MAYMILTVALRKESVDRNLQKLAEAIKPSVALRKESVDRNSGLQAYLQVVKVSLSARRAWIEIAGRYSDVSCY